MGKPRARRGACVYLLQGTPSHHTYKGKTPNLHRRIKQHNTKTKKFKYTNLHQPWVVYCFFYGFSETVALMFESITKKKCNWVAGGPAQKMIQMAKLASRFVKCSDTLKTSRGKVVRRPSAITLVCTVNVSASIRQLPGINVVCLYKQELSRIYARY